MTATWIGLVAGIVIGGLGARERHHASFLGWLTGFIIKARIAKRGLVRDGYRYQVWTGT
jgi:hypothetical protein